MSIYDQDLDHDVDDYADGYVDGRPQVSEETTVFSAQEVQAIVSRPPRHNNDDDDESGYFRRLVIGSIALLCVLALAFAAFYALSINHRNRLEASRQSCVEAVERLREDQTAYEDLLAGEGRAASVISDIQVSDASTVKALDAEMRAETPKDVQCDVFSEDELNGRIEEINTQSAWYAEHSKSLQAAIEGVKASKASYEVSSSQENLKMDIREAGNLLQKAEGHVTDQNTVQSLSGAISKAEEALKGNSIDEVNNASQELKDAMSKVSESRELRLVQEEEENKRKQEEERKKQEEQQKKQEEERRQQEEQRRQQEEQRRQQEQQNKQS